MEDIKKEINSLMDNLFNKDINNNELYMAKLIIVKHMLQRTSFNSFVYTRQLLKRLERSKSRRKNIDSRTNNFRKFLGNGI